MWIYLLIDHSKHLIFLLVLFACISDAAIAQPGVSDSRPYAPRTSNKTKEPRKLKPLRTKSPDDLVLPVSVRSRDGLAIGDLTKPEFTVFLNNGPVEVIGFENAKDKPANIVILIDTSPSSDSLLKAIVEFSTGLINDLRPNDRMMIAEFNNHFRIRQPFTGDKERLIKSLKGIRFGDGTSIYETVRELLIKHLAAEIGRTHVVVLTDGVDTTSGGSDYEHSLMEAERGNLTFIPVYLNTFAALPAALQLGRVFPGFPPHVSRTTLGQTPAEYQLGRDYLDDLAFSTGGRPYIFRNDSSSRATIASMIWSGIRSTYFLRISRPQPSTAIKRHSIRVRVSKDGLSVFAPGSYLTGND